MKYITLLSLLFCLLSISFVTAEDRTRDPNDPNLVTGMDSDDTWRADLTHQDILTNEDLSTDIKIEYSPQDDDDFDDHRDPDADLIDNDDDVDTTKDSDLVLQDQGHKTDGDFDYDLIRREIIGEAHNNMKINPEIDESDDDTDDADYVVNDVDASEPEKSVDSVDDDLRPDNGKISTQVSGNDYDDEIEDSDDGDDADIIDNTDSDDDAKVDYDYQQDDSGMTDDDYVNEPRINEVVDNDNDYTMDDDDDSDSDSDGDDTDDFLSKDYLRSHVNLGNIRLNLTTVEIQDDDDDDSNGDLNDIYYKIDDDDSGDDDSDSDYDIYDSKYQEEPEKGGSDDSQDSSFDYDIFIDVDDSVWDSYLADDDVNDNDDDLI